MYAGPGPTAPATRTAVPIVLLIRHAQASFGAEDYDVLSELGRRQVDALAGALERRGVVADVVVSGTLRRQRDTAQRWAQRTGARASVDARWNEYSDDDVLTHHSTSATRLARRPGDAPAVDSQTFQTVLDDALASWIEAGADGAGAQPWPAFRAGIEAALDDVARGLGRGETALVFSSGGTIAAAAAALLGLPAHAFVALNRVSVNTAISKVVVGRRGRSLVSYNEHGHLDEAGGDLLTYR